MSNNSFKKLNKKISAIILSALLSTTMLFTACGNNADLSTEINNDNQVILETEEVKEDQTDQNSDTEISKDSTDNSQEISDDSNIDEANQENTKTELNTDDSKKVSEENKSEDNKLEEETNIVNENVAANTEITASSVTKAEAGTPVANHGKLSVKGTKIVDKNGKPYQIQGVSTHGLGWFPEYVNKDAFKTMRDEWGINCVRLAMYTAEYNGYCSGGNQSELKGIVNNGVAYATDLGLYVIIDWHILSDNDPNINKAAAISFFDEMSKKYAGYDNVLYEICNEPNGGTSWSSIKSYALEVIPVIKKNDPNAIIIVGTPTWSQDVDIAANDPITGYSNIMYTIHFYAETHRDSLRSKMKTALSKGLPIMCTEFGICDASGNGTINEAEANKWISEMQANGVGYCIWNLSNKAESSSLIVNGCNKTSGWSNNDLSQEGKWYVGILGGKALGVTSTPTEATTDNNSNNSQNSNNNSAASTPAVQANSGNTEVSMVNSGNWNDGKNNCYQYTITIKNTGSSPIKNWKLTANLGTNVTLDQSWSGTFSANGSNVVITPCEYNKEIAAGQSVEVGFIVAVSGTISNTSVTIN